MADGAQSCDPHVQRQLDRLTMRSPGKDVLGLERINALLERLGNPQHDLPPVFHVAGTNGKGSTCAFLRAAIEASGRTTHVYTSPHLVRFNERIRIAGTLIDDAMLAPLLAEVNDAADDLAASFFEVTTAAAFLAFSRIDADACILEVGLGGRLDATNIVTQPAICGIAHLGLDHEAFLLSPEPDNPDLPAPALPRIAYEKAGIAKADTPLICQKYAPDMQLEIAKQAMRVGARLIDRGESWDATIYENKLHYRDAKGRLTLPMPGLEGAFQADNAALAIAMLRHQETLDIPISALSAAMGWAKWPARLQKLDKGQLTDKFTGADIWLDGGHNPLAGEVLAQHFAHLPDGKLHLVIAMLANKDPAAIIRPLLPKLASVTALPITGHDSHSAQRFGDYLAKTSIDFDSAETIEAAMIKLSDKRPETALISGSLYLAGEVLAANGQQPN